MTALFSSLFLLVAQDPAPEANDVKAGWTAFAVFLLLIAAVVLLCFSFVKQMRKVKEANEAGVYGSDDDTDGGSDGGRGSGAESDSHVTS